ncbi:MAG: hypothetical protein ACSHX7_05755 [Luteolibacter sp.]
MNILAQTHLTPIEPAIPLHLIVTIYIGVALLFLILLMLLKISSQLGISKTRSSSSSRSKRTSEPESQSEVEPNMAEVRPDTPFEEFLNEDPLRHNLPKKEQFKEYRKWRAAKGLNWKK